MHDVELYTAIHNTKSVAVLQSGLNELNEWANEWQLSIVINNCSASHIGDTNPGQSCSLQTVSLHNATESTNLGIIVNLQTAFLEPFCIYCQKNSSTFINNFRMFHVSRCFAGH